MRRRGRSAAVVRADPPVGSLFRLRGGEFSGSVLVRLLGFRENTGQCRYLLLPAHDPAGFFFEFPSFSYLSGHCDAISWSDLSRSMARVLSDVLSDPPTDHLVVRSVQSAGFCSRLVRTSKWPHGRAEAAFFAGIRAPATMRPESIKRPLSDPPRGP